MMREWIKAGFAAGMHGVGLDRLVGAGRGMRQAALVLSYHRVVEDFQASSARSIAPMLVGTRTFEAQLDWIGRRYDFVSLDELGRSLQGDFRGGRPLAAVTFDDGYGDTYYNAFPILRRKGIPMAAFVVTDLLGTTRLQTHDALYLLLSGALAQWRQPLAGLLELPPLAGLDAARKARMLELAADPFSLTRFCLAHLPPERMRELLELLREKVALEEQALHEFHALSWPMLEQMVQWGVTVGSHTRTHALLVREHWPTLVEELRGSRLLLEQRLGTPIRHFAYPDGRFDTNAVRAVSVAGYQYAYTTCLHRDGSHPLLTIPRRVLWENSCLDGFGHFSPAVLSCQLNGIFDPARRCRQQHGIQGA